MAWPALASSAAIAICLFGNLGALGLVGPDEPRYVWIARSMAETGDWVTPRLYGQPWFEKPILYYWAAAMGFLLHLPAEWAARLPSACAAFAAALAVAWLAKQYYGGYASSLSSPVLLAPVIFSTSVAAIGFARAATPDMLFSASITLAMACAATVFRNSGALRELNSAPRTPRGDALPLLLFGAFLGAAVLAKGPAAIVLAAGAIGLWALATKQWRAALRVAHPLAIATFCVVALPWYILCAVRNPDFLRVFLWQHNFERYVSPIFQHRQPFWYFGPIVLLALLPWTTLLWPTAQEGLRLWREKSWTNSPGLFFACWAVFPVLFFSVSQSKLPGYILPAIPPLALLCAVGVIRAISGGHSRTRRILGSLGIVWVLAAIAMGVAASPISSHVSGKEWPGLPSGMFAAAAVFLAALLLFAVNYFGKPSLVLLLCVVLLAAGVELVSLKFLPLLDSSVSARPHAEFMRNDQHPDRIFTYELRRSWTYGLTFYFRRELPEWSPRDPMPALVLTTPDGLEQIKKIGRFRGELEETRPGLVYVPIGPIPVSR
ncbi:MAG: phospholipid carrier-dependent glycosyltransferase [Candidatus Acidiferrales bacterium]